MIDNESSNVWNPFRSHFFVMCSSLDASNGNQANLRYTQTLYGLVTYLLPSLDQHQCYPSSTLQKSNWDVSPWASSLASSCYCAHTSSCDNWQHGGADGHNTWTDGKI